MYLKKYKKILYVMHVDWDWIKQRPHFIAINLSLFYKIKVIYPFAWRRLGLIKNSFGKLNPQPFFLIPFSGKFYFIRKINSLYMKYYMYILIKFYKPDIVWISSPEISNFLPEKLSAKLIYDCMDDVALLINNQSIKKDLINSESRLIARCSRVFCSSSKLLEQLVVRNGKSSKYTIVNNALEISSLTNFSKIEKEKKEQDIFIIGYIGTVSSWFDFKAVITLLNKLKYVEIHIIGPIYGINQPPPAHPNLKYLGSSSHDDLKNKVNNFDAFIMPFCLNELIESVDPVKIYEYIYFNKPIFCIRYKEVEKFSEFVDFYSNYDQLVNLVKKYKNGAKRKYTEKSRDKFILKNTWSDRCKIIRNTITLLG
jgi:hypothetical protein